VLLDLEETPPTGRPYTVQLYPIKDRSFEVGRGLETSNSSLSAKEI